MKKKKNSSVSFSEEIFQKKIFIIRDKKVMLDSHLAELYQVPTRVLSQAVKRNFQRFPEDFMFQLSVEETQNLRSQIVISSWGGRRYLPFAFTEQGVAMLSSVLRSEKAIQVNIAIMRVFVRVKSMLSAHKELTQKLNQLEDKFEKHDSEIQTIFEAIRRLMQPVEKPKRRIGFHSGIKEGGFRAISAAGRKRR